MRAKQAKANMFEIARITGQDIETVRYHKRIGKLNLDDFEGVCGYVIGQKLLRGIYDKSTGNGNKARKRKNS